MTMRPSGNSGIAGYATCLAHDSFRRCVVGQFNWCPAVLSVGGDEVMPDIISKDRTTALHEVIHVLGGIKPNDWEKSFRDPTTGNPLAKSDVFKVQTKTWNGVSRYEKIIVSERVKALAREQFKC